MRQTLPAFPIHQNDMARPPPMRLPSLTLIPKVVEVTDPATFAEACAVLDDPTGGDPQQRKQAERALSSLRRNVAAIEICNGVFEQQLYKTGISTAFHAVCTLKYAALFHWARLTDQERNDAFQKGLALLDAQNHGADPKQWQPVRNQALLALGLWAKRMAVGVMVAAATSETSTSSNQLSRQGDQVRQEMESAAIKGIQLIASLCERLDVHCAIAEAIEDGTNLALVASPQNVHIILRKMFSIHGGVENAPLPALLKRASLELAQQQSVINDSNFPAVRALEACASWELKKNFIQKIFGFAGQRHAAISCERAVDGWDRLCGDAALGLQAHKQSGQALKFLPHLSRDDTRGWQVLCEIIKLESASPNEIATAADALMSRPNAEALDLMLKLLLHLLPQDFNDDDEDALAVCDAARLLMKTLERSHWAAGADGALNKSQLEALMQAWFSQIIMRANIPDAYDDTLQDAHLSSSNTDGAGIDLIRSAASMLGRDPRCAQSLVGIINQAATTALSNVGNNEHALDVLHVSLSFVTELFRDGGLEARQVLLPAIINSLDGQAIIQFAQMSPLCVADALRALRRAVVAATPLDDDDDDVGLSQQEVQQLVGIVYNALIILCVEPDCCSAALGVLEALARHKGSLEELGNRFLDIISNENAQRIPNSVVSGYARALGIAAKCQRQTAALLDKCNQLFEDTHKRMHQFLEGNVVDTKGEQMLARRISSLAGLAKGGQEAHSYFLPFLRDANIWVKKHVPRGNSKQSTGEALLAAVVPLATSLVPLGNRVAVPDATGILEASVQSIFHMGTDAASRKDALSDALDLAETLFIGAGTPCPQLVGRLAVMCNGSDVLAEQRRAFKLLADMPASDVAAHMESLRLLRASTKEAHDTITRRATAQALGPIAEILRGPLHNPNMDSDTRQQLGEIVGCVLMTGIDTDDALLHDSLAAAFASAASAEAVEVAGQNMLTKASLIGGETDEGLLSVGYKCFQALAADLRHREATATAARSAGQQPASAKEELAWRRARFFVFVGEARSISVL